MKCFNDTSPPDQRYRSRSAAGETLGQEPLLTHGLVELTGETLGEQGERLGTAYRLADGQNVYVPD